MNDHDDRILSPILALIMLSDDLSSANEQAAMHVVMHVVCVLPKASPWVQVEVSLLVAPPAPTREAAAAARPSRIRWPTWGARSGPRGTAAASHRAGVSPGDVRVHACEPALQHAERHIQLNTEFSMNTRLEPADQMLMSFRISFVQRQLRDTSDQA